MTKRITLAVLGGFLGSGKTTTLLRLARHYTAAGRSVGIVTNDQAENLVDSRRPPELSRAGNRMAEAGHLLINARSESEPARLREVVEWALADLASRRTFRVVPAGLASFAPARPEPTYRTRKS